MKIQDIIFIIILLFLLWKRRTDWIIYAGLAFFALSIPLFALWVFFTAQKLIWYGAVFILIAAVLKFLELD